MAKILRKIWLISGNVQGVGYRAYCASAARMFGITGHAKNLANGKVEIFAEGDEDSLNSFYEYLAHGPGFIAKVENVKTEQLTNKSKFFEVD